MSTRSQALPGNALSSRLRLATSCLFSLLRLSLLSLAKAEHFENSARSGNCQHFHRFANLVNDLRRQFRRIAKVFVDFRLYASLGMPRSRHESCPTIGYN
jgi:hypothetical protein